MDPAKVSVLGGGDRFGLSEEDPIVYVHSQGVEYSVTHKARQSKFDTLDMNSLLTHPCFLAVCIQGGWTSH